MDCEELTELVYDLDDGALAGDARRDAEAHLDGCGRCARSLERARRLQDVVTHGSVVPELAEHQWDAQRSRIVARAALSSRPADPAETRAPRGRFVAGLLLATSVGVGAWVHARWLEATSQEDPSLTTEPVVAPPPEPERRPEAFTLDGWELDETRPALPGEPDHLLVMAAECVEAGLADSNADRVRALLRAAGDRLSELRTALRSNDLPLAEELAQSYSCILSEGVTVVLADDEATLDDRLEARTLTRAQVVTDEQVLARLMTSAPAPVKGALEEALVMCQKVGRL